MVPPYVSNIFQYLQEHTEFSLPQVSVTYLKLGKAKRIDRSPTSEVEDDCKTEGGQLWLLQLGTHHLQELKRGQWID